MDDNIKYASPEVIEKAQAKFMSSVYSWMVLGLTITALAAWQTVESGFYEIFFSSSIMFFGIIIAELAIVFYLTKNISKMSTAVAGLTFAGFSILNGLTLSVVLLTYTSESIQNVFGIAASMFLAISLYGYTTKKDLTGVGSFMFMGLVGIIVASVFNYIIGSSMLSFIISVIGVIVFAGLTAYDTQRLKEMYVLQLQDEEAASKGAIIGALHLYLDFINLFLFLLRLFGDRD